MARLDSERAFHGSRATGRPESKCCDDGSADGIVWIHPLSGAKKGPISGSIDTGPFIVDPVAASGIIPGVSLPRGRLSTGCIYRAPCWSASTSRRALAQGLLAQAEVAIDGASVAKSEATSIVRGRLRLVWERESTRTRSESWPADFQADTGGTVWPGARPTVTGCGADARAA